MNKIKNKKFPNKEFPNAYNLLIETYNMNNVIRFFYFCIFFLRIAPTEDDTLLTKDDIVELYVESKKTINNIRKFINECKFKIYKKYEYNCDLNFVELSNYHEDKLIKLIQNKTIYTFKISDLISLWKISLFNNDNMFPLPKKIKNPFTNILFEDYQLYNIFFKYAFTGNITSHIIMNFFKSNFNMLDFRMESHEMLQMNSIKKYILKGSVPELYDYLIMLMHDFRRDIDYIFVKTNISIFKKLSLVKQLEKYIKYYLIYKYVNNPTKKDYYSKKISTHLKNSILLIRDDVFVHLSQQEINRYDQENEINNNTQSSIDIFVPNNDYSQDEMQIEEAEQEIIQNNNYTVISEGDIENNLNEQTPLLFPRTLNLFNRANRRSSYPRTFPPIITNTYTNTNPFQPRNEIPRSPTNNTQNDIASRFNLGIR